MIKKIFKINKIKNILNLKKIIFYKMILNIEDKRKYKKKKLQQIPKFQIKVIPLEMILHKVIHLGNT